MQYLVLVAVCLPCILAVPMMELTQAHHLQTDVDMGKPIQNVFESFKQIHGK